MGVVVEKVGVVKEVGAVEKEGRVKRGKSRSSSSSCRCSRRSSSQRSTISSSISSSSSSCSSNKCRKSGISRRSPARSDIRSMASIPVKPTTPSKTSAYCAFLQFRFQKSNQTLLIYTLPSHCHVLP